MKGTRSTVNLNNLQEVADSGGDLRRGLAQYFTPSDIAERVRETLEKRALERKETISSVIDPQCGDGNLVNAFCYKTTKFGVDISKTDLAFQDWRLTEDCRKFGEVLDDVFPDMAWACGVANFPFNLPWKGVNPCAWTWDFLQRHTRFGCMIGPDDDEMRELARKDGVWHTERLKWPEANVVVRLIYYETDVPPSSVSDLYSRWRELREILKQEGRKIPEHNVWLKEGSKINGRNGTLSVFLSARHKTKFKITRDDARRLMRLDGNTPEVLAVDRETRTLLENLVENKIYKVSEDAREAIQDALKDARRVSTPIMPVTEFERVAYLDEEDTVKCVKSWGPFEEGHSYRVASMNYTFRQHFTRKKPHFNEKTGWMEVIDHECSLNGQDRKIVVRAGEEVHEFLANPNPDLNYQHHESLLWEIFSRPKVETVAERFPERVAEIRRDLEMMEIFGGFNFFSGQLDYLSRVLVRDNALIAAETGTGKSLCSIAAYVAKGASRCLIVCPKGTVAGGEHTSLSQWVGEIHRFAPHVEVFEMFTKEDYDRIRRLNGGKLPNGFYVTYYDAFFTNKAMENCSWKNADTPRWNDDKLYEMVNQPGGEDRAEDIVSVGEEINGIRCIAQPSLATLIGHEFDMVCLDEAHNIKTMSANRTQAAIRLSPRYRYAFTATPVPNIATDIFPIMGWVCVDDWYKGDTCNAAWPFRREDLGRFEAIFLSKERDYTAERMTEKRTGKPSRVEKVSPVLSSPARLLKIIKPAIAYITKGQCNPDYLPPRIVDVRVPMGRAQARLYSHFANRDNITMTIARKPITTPLVRGGAQIEWLRCICTDPDHASRQAMLGSVGRLNPKVMAILDLVSDCMERGEQVVIVNSRHGITNILHDKLEEAGVSVSRIDSSERSGNHSEESNLFKLGHTRVMLMGIKCAVGHSYDKCRNLIIGSLEYSPGPFEQARGRVDRLTSQESRIYCILCKDSIEAVMFDTVATKDDASKIILRGERIPREFKPVDMSEVLMDSLLSWGGNDGERIEEETCQQLWETLKKKLQSYDS